MTKNINFVSHKKSKQIVDGKPKLPLASALVEGEIAVNYAKDVETLSIKNESGTVVTFSSDGYYTEQKLGSGFTGENSTKTVTEVIEEDERITAAALNDLEDTKLEISNFDSYSGEVETAINNKADVVHTHDANSVTAMTGYVSASTSSNISTTDTLLQAIGKLETRIAILEAALDIQPNGDIYNNFLNYDNE